MAIIQCPECGKEISDQYKFCGYCGFPLKESVNKITHTWRCVNCGNMTDSEICSHCGKSSTEREVNVSSAENVIVCSLNDNKSLLINKSKKVSKKIILSLICSVTLISIIAILSITIILTNNDKSGKTNTIDMGAIGNKINVDGMVAYVAGENKILVPYGFCGNFSECSSVVYGESLKGCENPRLPADETDDLPEEAAREIISFYGDIGGFWTSIEADHARIEIIGAEPKSLHYAGIMDNYFSVGSDGVADAAWGYCLDATNDTTPMGLLVLYDVIVDKFEFTDFVSYSQTPISINQNFFSDLGLPYSEINKKYGEVTRSGFLDGGGYYIFENGHGLYFFKDKNGNSAFFDENETSEYLKPQIPDNNAECFLIQANITDFFDNFKGCKPIVDVEQELGISIECYENEVDGGYTCSFNYKGYSIHIDLGYSQTTVFEYNSVAKIRYDKDSQSTSSNNQLSSSSSTNSNVESSDDSILTDQSNTVSNGSSNNTKISLPIGKYTLSHVFSPFIGWIKIVDSNGNYSDKWKAEELNRIKISWESWPEEIVENDIQKCSKAFERIQPNMYIDVSEKWMECYNIYNDFDLCKGIIDEMRVYETDDESYSHWISGYSSVDSSMGKWHPLDAEIYEIQEDGLAYLTYWGYNFSYYPDVKGIGVPIDNCDYNYKMLFTLQ